MLNKKRVLHIGLSDTFGGIESFLLSLCENMDRERYLFDFVAYGSKVARREDFEKQGNILCLSNRKNLLCYKRELSHIYKQGYSIIHIHKNSPADVMPFLCAKDAGKAKFIVHSHSTSNNVPGFCFINGFGRKKILKVANRKLACSKMAGEWLYGSINKIDSIVPNGINLEKYSFDLKKREYMRTRLGYSDELILGCVGRFTPVKNQLYVLKILKQLVANSVKSKVLFLGDGNELASVKAETERMGLSDAVTFAGSVNNVGDYMQAMDALAMPSKFEGLPIAAIEAQASGLPVVLSHNISAEACLVDNVVRLPIADADISSWANEIVRLTSSTNRIGPMDKRLYSFDIINTVRIMDEEYQRVLD